VSNSSNSSSDTGEGADENAVRALVKRNCKPPQHTKFVNGQIGNPKGRPKGAKNFKTLLLAELKKLLPIVENGKRRKITKQGFRHTAGQQGCRRRSQSHGEMKSDISKLVLVIAQHNPSR
jgi:Family of unknown function (DUF5681)